MPASFTLKTEFSTAIYLQSNNDLTAKNRPGKPRHYSISKSENVHIAPKESPGKLMFTNHIQNSDGNNQWSNFDEKSAVDK